VALPGIAQEADTAQFPQSTRPLEGSVRHAGWLCGSAAEGSALAISRAPSPP